MKHLKVYNEYVLESVKGLDYIYNKYYFPDLVPRKKFDEIIAADPTTKQDKMGMYCKWLLELYKNGKLMSEDLYKATEYLKLYHRFKHSLPIEKRNINVFKSLPDLAKIIEPFKEPVSGLLSSSENKKAAFVKSFKNYDLYIPTTYEQSRDLGRDTEWCTAADSENGRDNFEKYKNSGTLYIFINKRFPYLKYQLHFEEVQFMDVYDAGVCFFTFLYNDNFDIEKYFHLQITEVQKYLRFTNLEISTDEDYPDTTYFHIDDKIVFDYEETTKTIWVDPLYGTFFGSEKGIADLIKEKMREIYHLDIEDLYFQE